MQIEEFAMNKISDNDYYDFLIDNINIHFRGITSDIVRINELFSLWNIKSDQPEACALGEYPYRFFSHLYIPTSTIAAESSGVLAVQKNPHLNLYGRGVIVGVIDTGIDYRHPAFRYPDGSSRILSIWDQTIQAGPPPEGFPYGTEYTRELLNEALMLEEPLSLVPSSDPDGHGTAIASIIAGSPDPENSFSGIAPDAGLAVVKLKNAKQNIKDIYFVPEDINCYQETDILFGMAYLLSISETLKRPLVMCLAMGSNQGIHDGFSATSNYADYLARSNGIGIVISAGNEGNTRRHYYSFINTEPYYHDFELHIGENDQRFSMEIWPDVAGKLSITITSPNRESTRQIYPALYECREFRFIFSDTKIWVNNITVEQETGSQLILIRFEDPLPGIWHLQLENTSNELFSFHAWLPAGDMISRETYFLNPDPDTTITSPGNGHSQLTVGAYNHFDGSLLPESGRGYTKSGLVKPDIAAPGYLLPCALPDYGYGTATGTGAAAAHTSGVVAMLMEWAIDRGNYTSITGNDITTLIERGANRSAGEIYPNNRLGYGRLSIDGLFRRIANL